MSEDCGHGLHRKFLIRRVGEVCLECDPTWREYETVGVFSILGHVPTEQAPVDPQ